jgi:hypothetical protein
MTSIGPLVQLNRFGLVVQCAAAANRFHRFRQILASWLNGGRSRGLSAIEWLPLKRLKSTPTRIKCTKQQMRTQANPGRLVFTSWQTRLFRPPGLRRERIENQPFRLPALELG